MKPEHERAKAWRISRDLSLDQLSELTGYSKVALYKFEAGYTQAGDGIKYEQSEWVWQRYRMACAGVAAQLDSGRVFAW